MSKSYQIRELDPADIDKLISLKGIVIRVSDAIPEMKEAYYKCAKCAHVETKFVERGKVTEPELCQSCSAKGQFELIHN